MAKVVRAMIVALALGALVVPDARAKESYCRSALDLCIGQCERYPVLFTGGCSAGCVLMYLSCD